MHHRLCVTGSSPRGSLSARRKTRHHFGSAEIASDNLDAYISGAGALYLHLQWLRQKSELLPSRTPPSLKGRPPSHKIKPHRYDHRHLQMARGMAYVAVWRKSLLPAGRCGAFRDRIICSIGPKTRSRMSLRASAKATLARMKPSFEPQSNMRPANGEA